MKKEYDFSKGERGKFYTENAELNLPVYLDPDVEAFIRQYSQKKNVDLQIIVNEWLRKDIEVIQSVL
jgi:hypothetical protein